MSDEPRLYCPPDCPCEARTGNKLPVLRGTMNKTKRAELKHLLQQACNTLKKHQEDWHRSPPFPGITALANIVRMTAELVLDDKLERERDEARATVQYHDQVHSSFLDRLNTLESERDALGAELTVLKQDPVVQAFSTAADEEISPAALEIRVRVREREKERAQVEAILARRSALDGLNLVEKVQRCIDVAKKSESLAATLNTIVRRLAEDDADDAAGGYPVDSTAWAEVGRRVREEAKAALIATGFHS